MSFPVNKSSTENNSSHGHNTLQWAGD